MGCKQTCPTSALGADFITLDKSKPLFWVETPSLCSKPVHHKTAWKTYSGTKDCQFLCSLDVQETDVELSPNNDVAGSGKDLGHITTLAYRIIHLPQRRFGERKPQLHSLCQENISRARSLVRSGYSVTVCSRYSTKADSLHQSPCTCSPT